MSTYLGQNFLIDNKIQRYIADKTALLYQKHNGNTIIEIGPGKGAITKYLAKITNNLIIIEKDTTLKEFREKQDYKPTIIRSDILEIQREEMKKNQTIDPHTTLIVGNLPYYITSPILRQCFGGDAQIFPGGVCMIQKEVGEKIRSDGNKKSFLRRLLNYGYTVKYGISVPPKYFRPPPKVTSCIMLFEKKTTLPDISYTNIESILNICGPFTRKTLGKIWKMQQPNIVLPEALQKKRLEECTWEDLSGIV